MHEETVRALLDLVGNGELDPAEAGRRIRKIMVPGAPLSGGNLAQDGREDPMVPNSLEEVTLALIKGVISEDQFDAIRRETDAPG